MAHKKGQGSSRNGRDSKPQYRGLKAYGGQLVGLVFLSQWLDYRVKIAGHDVVEFVQGQIDAMVGNAALREIVGANFLRTVPGADQLPACLGLAGLMFFLFGGVESCLKYGGGARAVLVLRALVLAFDHDPAG